VAFAGAAHGDVGEFPAAAVGEDVGAVNGGALGSVDGDGVRVVEAIRCEVLVSEGLDMPGVEADGE